MKKKLLVLVLTALVLCTVLAFAGIASAAVSIEAKTEYFMGEYNNLFADREDINGEGYLAKYGKDAVIVFGKFSGEETANYDCGMIFYPYGETIQSEDAKIFFAKKLDNEGNFGIAISLSGDLLDSGKWNAKAFYKLKEDALNIDNCFTSNEETTFNTTTEKYDAPASIDVDALGVVTWETVADADFYSVQIKAGNASDWIIVANQTETTWSLTDYLKGLTTSELETLEDQTLAIRVGANGDEKRISDFVTIENVYGGEHVLKVVENKADLTEYSYDADSSLYNYIVLANDLVLGDITPESMTAGGNYPYIEGNLKNAKLNGLGHKISFVFDDTQCTSYSSTADHRFMLWTNVNANVSIMNLSIDANITTQKAKDGNGVYAIARSLNGTVYNSFFKVRANLTQISTPSSSLRVRNGLSDGGTSTWNNCIFDMVTYSSTGNIVAGGEGVFDQVLSGSSAIVNNCSYITNGASTTKPWTRYASGQTINNSAMYATYPAFTTAWALFDENTKASYNNAGFSVSEEGNVLYNGSAIYTAPVGQYLAPNSIAFADGFFTWDPVADAQYKVKVLAGSTQIGDLVETEKEEFNFSAWLKSLDSTTLSSLEGKKMYIQVQSVGEKKTDSDFSMQVQLVNYSNGGDSVSNTVIRLVDSIETLRTKISANRWNGYYVLTNDIILDEETSNSLIITDDSTAIISEWADSAEHKAGNDYKYLAYISFRGTLDGQGRTISYTINDETMTGKWCGLFQNMRAGSTVINLNLKAQMTRSYTEADSSSFNCLLVEDNQGAHVYGCNFDFKLTTTEGCVMDYTRTCVIRKGVSGGTNMPIQTFVTNCVFNVRSYTFEGVLREGVADKCEGKAIGEGAGAVLVNCAYIANTETGNKTMGGANSNSASYVDLDAFINAWTNDELANKDEFVRSGWSVEGTTLKFWGTAIN